MKSRSSKTNRAFRPIHNIADVAEIPPLATPFATFKMLGLMPSTAN